MKCEYCGATMPDPPSAPSYSESYKELREEIGRLEYNNGVIAKDKKKIEDWLISCRESLSHHQSSEKAYEKEKKVWKRLATVLFVTNILIIAVALST